MRPVDFVPAFLICALAVFFLVPATRALYEVAYGQAPIFLSFLKFGLLATAGEILAMRINTGSYDTRGFGVIPKMIVWGFLGVAIYWAFIIFASGTPNVFPAFGKLPAPWNKILNAFAISVFMNIIFAPPMMLTHHLTDRFIGDHNGRFPIGQLDMLDLLKRVDWDRMWGFVFKKTIPLFWIPAHTITFLLPENYRVLFAVMLSVVLGLILGSVRSRKTTS